MKQQVNKDGKLFAKVSEKVDITQMGNGEAKTKGKAELDIPSKGIHKTIIKDGGNVEVVDGQDFSNNAQRRSDNSVVNGIDKMNFYSGLEYTPLDMAEYIFWTGDEKGVIMAIEEFLEESLMSREEAINFLQSIKSNLDYMQEHYHGLQKTGNKMSTGGWSNIRDRLTDLGRSSSFDYEAPQDGERMKVDAYDESPNKYEGSDPYDKEPSKIQFAVYEKDGPGSFGDRKKRFRDDAKATGKYGLNDIAVTDDEFEDLVEKLKVADFLYSEYSLEEVIYQLAKVVFSQSLRKGSAEAQAALQRFTFFLEKEARLGQISRNLERKIIDLLITALSDSLSEHPQLLKESLNDVDAPMLSGSVDSVMGNSPSANKDSLSSMPSKSSATSKN